MGLRPSTLDTHPQKEEILKALVKGEEPYRIIANRFKVGKASIQRYVQSKIYPEVVAAKTEAERKAGSSMLEMIEKTMSYVQKMYESCNDWLQDPTNPDRYELGPRGYEINVVYKDEEGVKKATLQSLLNGLEDKVVLDLSGRIADPRKLILDTANALNKQLELLAKIEGLVKDNYTVAQDPQAIYLTMIQIVENATKTAPEVRNRIIKALETAGNA